MNKARLFTLLGVVFCASFGDLLLKRGMSQVGEVRWDHLWMAVAALANPWILCGTCLLIGFFALYSSALSWADLTYVLPATSFYNIIVPLMALFFLHEAISLHRWIGILLVTAGVGFVATGPMRTEPEEAPRAEAVEQEAAR